MNAFTFAGFTFPRPVVMMPRGSFAKRIERMRKPLTGPYIHWPQPRKGGHTAWFFYLDSDFAPGMRWRWCDDVATGIRHTGWFLDDYHHEKARGIVLTLPHGRGFLAGWSMGESMASEVESYIYESEHEAAHAADRCAELVAERERERADEQRDEFELGAE